MAIKKVFKPCAEDRHKQCKGKIKGKICTCPCHSKIVKEMLVGKASIKDITGITIRKVFAGLPLKQRQTFEEVCIFCGNGRTVYPSEELFPEEVEERQQKYICRECERKDSPSLTPPEEIERVKRKSKKQQALEFKRQQLLRQAQALIGEDGEVCENCGDEHATEECPE